MAEHLIGIRRVVADPPTGEHYALAQSARDQGLPDPEVFEWTEMRIAVTDVDGLPIETRTVRHAGVSNCLPPSGEWEPVEDDGAMLSHDV